jgi:hypothetical protein
VSGLKVFMSCCQGLQIESQELSVAGTRMEDSKTLEDYGIIDGTQVDLVGTRRPDYRTG